MPLKKPSEFYSKNKNTSLDEVKEELNNVQPEKVERISEAFDSFKENFNQIKTLSEFTESFDTFKTNVEKVDTLTENVEGIRESINDLISKQDLDEAMTAQLFFVEESIRGIQDRIKILNSNSVLEIKEEYSALSDTVSDFLDVEVPSYKRLITDSETRVDGRFKNFKEDLTSKVDEVHDEIYLNLESITKNIESINEENLSSVKNEVKGIKGTVESLLEKVLPKYKKFFADTEVRTEEKLSANEKLVKETADDIEKKYESKIKGVKEDFNNFINVEVPKYKNLLVASQLKSEDEIKEISSQLDSQVFKVNEHVSNLQQRVNNKEIEIDEVLLEKTNTIEKLISKSKELSRTYDDLSKDFKVKEQQYESALEDFSSKINKMEESLSDNICELQENLDTSTSKYHDELKNAVVPAVVNFEKNLSSQLKELKINFAVNEKHVDSIKKEFKDLIEKIRVDDIEEKNNELRSKVLHLEEVLEKFNEKEVLNEGLLNIPPNVDNSDPLTPLDKEYVTLDQLQEHYRLFINRVQQQLATFGGGGAVRLDDLEDVGIRTTGISTNNLLIYNGNKWVGIASTAITGGGNVGSAGTWATTSAGIHTTKNVGVATTARSDIPLFVGKGPTAGSGTTTIVAFFDGDISVAGTIFKENVKNVDSIGLVTARTGVDVGYNYEDGAGVGITMKASGNACFSGIVTAYHQFYPPVITTTERDALTVSAGALIFNTTSTQLEIYNGTTWVGVGAVNNLTIANL